MLEARRIRRLAVTDQLVEDDLLPARRRNVRQFVDREPVLGRSDDRLCQCASERGNNCRDNELSNHILSPFPSLGIARAQVGRNEPRCASRCRPDGRDASDLRGSEGLIHQCAPCAWTGNLL